MDDFEQDSFVVGNSEVEYETSFDELDLVDEFGSEDDLRRTRIKRKKKSIETTEEEDEDENESCPPKKKLKKKNNRQRIRMADSSSSDVDEEVVILSQHKVGKNSQSAAKSGSGSVRKSENIQGVSERVVVSPVSRGLSNSSEKKLENSYKTSMTVKSQSVNEISSATATTSSMMNVSVCSTSSNAEQLKRRTVIVASTEVHRAVDVISDLKHRFNVDVVVRSGLCVGFVLSPRLGVHRMSVKDFCNGANRAGLVEQCQKMNDLFEKPCLIVETERPDNPDLKRAFCGGFVEQHGGLHRTKYVDTILAQLSQSKFQVLFSGSQPESAQILSALSAKELRKGHSLPCPLRLSPNAEKVLPFYQSLPGVSFGTALLLAANFKSAKDFLNAAQATVIRKIGLDEAKGRKLREFCKKKFEPAMTSAGR